jgi:hypothetical protein
MAPAQLVNGRKRVLFSACALLAAIVATAVIGTRDAVQAQAGAPAPGWIELPAGGWVPPGHPLANGGRQADAREECGLRRLRGSYVFTASGYNVVGGVPQPKAIVELIDFNGDGTLTVPGGTVSINGTVTQNVSGIGVYTLDTECRGTIAFTPGPSFDIFVEPNGKQAAMIQTNPGTVFQGTLTRVSR